MLSNVIDSVKTFYVPFFMFLSVVFTFLFVALIASWNRLLNWSENAAGLRRLQQEIAEQKQLFNSMEITDEWVLNSEEAIRDKIQELNVSVKRINKLDL